MPPEAWDLLPNSFFGVDKAPKLRILNQSPLHPDFRSLSYQLSCLFSSARDCCMFGHGGSVWCLQCPLILVRFLVCGEELLVASWIAGSHGACWGFQTDLEQVKASDSQEPRPPAREDEYVPPNTGLPPLSSWGNLERRFMLAFIPRKGDAHFDTQLGWWGRNLLC